MMRIAFRWGSSTVDGYILTSLPFFILNGQIRVGRIA